MKNKIDHFVATGPDGKTAKGKTAQQAFDNLTNQKPKGMKMARKSKPAQSLQTIEIARQQESMMAIIANAASNPKFDADKMNAIIAAQRQMNMDAAELAFALAMRDCQQEILPVARKAENKHTSSKYAKLENIDEAIRPIYTKHGFSLSFDSEESPDGQRVTVFCDVSHISGCTKRRKLTGGLDLYGAKGNANKNVMQGLGSSVSYLKRYLTCMIFNIQLKDEDDDGNGSGKPVNANKPSSAFSQRVQQDSGPGDSAGPVHDAHFEELPPQRENKSGWDGKIFIEGAVQNIQANTPLGAGRYLMGVMKKRNHKKSRIDLINENTGLLRALKEAGDETLIQELHKLADEGK